MKRVIIIAAAIIVIAFIAVLLNIAMKDYETTDGETLSGGGRGGKSGSKAADDAKKQNKEEEEILMLPLKSFTGSEYIDPANKIGIIETNMGTIKIKFFPDAAPNTVQSFIHLANKKFFDGLTFHRVIDGFVIQGGCPKGDGTGGPDYRLKAEFNDNKHLLGAVSMARTDLPDTAGSQFFICLKEIPHLDHKYTVFGTTIDGLDVVLKIGKVKTDKNDKPVTPVIIKSVRIIDAGVK